MDDVIVTENLTKRYGTTLALDALDLTVRAGEAFGFLGPNGAGKTTAIRLMLGLLRPTAGTVSVLGRDATRDPVAAHRGVAYVPGEFSAWPWLTGAETLELLARLHGTVDRAYRDELVEVFDFDPTRPARSYSRGNRQKIAVIAAFASRAPLLVMDEPTSGLDPLMEAAFRRCVAAAVERGQAIFLSSHILSEVEATCDRVGMLREGRLVSLGTLDELRGLASRTLEITVAGDVPALTSVDGVEAVTVSGHTITCRVSGELTPLLAALRDTRVLGIDAREASLEEVFMARYGAGSGSASA